MRFSTYIGMDPLGTQKGVFFFHFASFEESDLIGRKSQEEVNYFYQLYFMCNESGEDVHHFFIPPGNFLFMVGNFKIV